MPPLFFIMTFGEEIELQLKNSEKLSYELLTDLKEKKYFSGRDRQVGDIILFGMLKEEGDDEQLTLKLVSFHEDEIGVLYEEDDAFYNKQKSNTLPIIKLIENGNQEERL